MWAKYVLPWEEIITRLKDEVSANYTSYNKITTLLKYVVFANIMQEVGSCYVASIKPAREW